jgi:dipeptidyl aminopeptidase/acylaminoacyl peptidase
MRSKPSFFPPNISTGEVPQVFRIKFLRSFLLLAVCFGMMAAVSPSREKTFTAYHLPNLQAVTSLEISPDGGHIAYVLSKPRDPFEDETGPAHLELRVTDLEGNSRPFVTGKIRVSQIAWRPGNQEISFLAKREGDKQTSLYLIPLEGGESRKVLEHETDIANYSWSPDGDQFAFLASEAESDEEKKWREKGFNQEIYEESARPVRLWIASIKEDSRAGNPQVLDLPGSASVVHWSPAGEQMAVALAPTPLVDDSFMRRLVRIVHVNSGEVLAQLEHEAKLGQFGWSPDGQRLFTISGENINDPREGRLYLWSSEGEKIRELFPDYPGHIWSAAWKDNETIRFIGHEGVWTALHEINVENGAGEILLPPQGPIAGDLSLSRNGRMAFSGQTPEHPGEVFIFEAETKSPRRLTSSNRWLADLSLSPHEIIKYKARDGLELEGILIRPLRLEEGRRYPLILVVHGGPEAHYANGWLTTYANPGQIAAARGFALFYPNYRGSTGRGVEFSKAGQGDPAGREFDDLVDAVDHLVELGLVDTDRVGITGGSYGGYASAWGATRYSDRFAASVMFVGISNWLSAFGTGDIPYEMYHAHFLKWVWEDREFFLQRSPVGHIEKHRTPILILHGKDDPRVHHAQGLELYRYLKLLGQAPVRLVSYPGEAHGNQKTAAQLDYALRLMQWMEHYLQGPRGEPPPFQLDYQEAEEKFKEIRKK